MGRHLQLKGGYETTEESWPEVDMEHLDYLRHKLLKFFKLTTTPYQICDVINQGVGDTAIRPTGGVTFKQDGRTVSGGRY